MKIKVKAIPDSSQRTFEYDVTKDIGLTEKEWNSFSDKIKEKIIQDMLNGEHEQPYWILDKFEPV